MTKLQQAIKSHMFPPYNMDLRYLSIMEENLTDTTKEYIERGNLDLRILAVLIRDTLSEAESKERIDKLLWDKLHDQDLVIKLMGEIL